jgi:hypothetical protein
MSFKGHFCTLHLTQRLTPRVQIWLWMEDIACREAWHFFILYRLDITTDSWECQDRDSALNTRQRRRGRSQDRTYQRGPILECSGS